MLRVTLRNIARLLPLLGTDETREYAMGFIIEPHWEGGCTLVALDGVVLGAIYDPAAQADSTTTWVPSRVLRAAAESYKPIATVTISDFGETIENGKSIPKDDEMVELTAPTMGYTVKNPIEGKWRECFARPNAGTLAIIDPAKAAKFAAVHQFEDDIRFTMRGGPNEPQWIGSKGVTDFIGCLMPLKQDSIDEVALPAWLMPPPKN